MRNTGSSVLISFLFLSPAAKQWKRMVTKCTFVGAGFTRKPPKYKRFIRPSGLRFTKAHVTHPELKCTFNLDIIGVKKNPNAPMYTSLGVMTKGTIIEVFFCCCYSFLYIWHEFCLLEITDVHIFMLNSGECKWIGSGHTSWESCLG